MDEIKVANGSITAVSTNVAVVRDVDLELTCTTAGIHGIGITNGIMVRSMYHRWDLASVRCFD